MLKTNFKNIIKHFTTKANNNFYVTTPIFYVNAAPHIGHLYSAVIADAICRYRRLIKPNDKVHFCTGTDEHGTKVQQASAAHNKNVAHYCSDIAMRYQQVFQEAFINNNDFIRTTEQRHERAVAHFWNELLKRKQLYSAQYSGWYCVSDETFLTDSQLRYDAATGTRYSLESGHPVEWTEETNYMFPLSSWQQDVLYWVKQGNRIRPKKFEKILLESLSEPLPDVSVSRPAERVHWAIPVPNDSTQTIYVWLDALINYLTSVGYPDEKYCSHWPPNVQVIGKDILKFHGIYWPAFLIAAGLEPPQQLFVHSHWTVDGQKMSKSKHNVVNPQEAAKVYSMEGLRYFLLREGVAHSDGNYSSTKALRILNSELADTLGNLLSRCCAKSLNPRQVYPTLHAKHFNDILRLDAAKHLQEKLLQLEASCRQHFEDNNFYLVVDAVMSTLHAANNFFECLRPWELKNATIAAQNHHHLHRQQPQHQQQQALSDSSSNMENTNRLETIIAMTMDTLRCCAIVLQPIVPDLSGKLLEKLNVPTSQRLWCNLKDHFANNAEDGLVRAADLPLASNDAVLFRRIQLTDSDNTIADNAVAAATTKQSKKSKKL